MKRYKILLVLSFLLLKESLFSQVNADDVAIKKDPPAPCQELWDSNRHILIPSQGFILLYFFSPKQQESLKLKSLLPLLTLEPEMPMLCINLDLNRDIKDTFKVLEIPAITILYNRRILYSLVGFTQDVLTLSKIINREMANRIMINEY